MEVVFFKQATKFLYGLENDARVKTYRLIERLKSEGNTLSVPVSKNLGQGLFELRTLGSISIRLFYCFREGKAYVLCGIIKKSQRIPRKEIKYARMLKSLL